MTETSENVQSYEDMFSQRFSAEDQEYQQYVSRPADPPPIVEDWRRRGGGNQRGRDNRYQDRRGQRDQGWRGNHRGWQDRDRHWGHGSGYQSGPPSSNQAYNSYYQRPQYDRY
ncbi:RNA guanine-N7 methyltransferase-activating subunit-like protein [Nothobranchius furzeri]|uniref:RNA guanine-7 methyltransferase activating subunit n=1 Tax=Nothobranchius furzeri TaxID=105023 RepID=A0A8C6PUK8_NOTFU|nr:RNA guanine-N7 methyltransferase-activating subunit-like protein [Nothobranchius furzeri]